MSQHEIEDVVADSILLLHEHDEAADHRSFFHALLRFQAGFDCGFTHGRVIEALIARRHTYVLPLTAHPDYVGHEKAFAKHARKKNEFAFVDSDVLRREQPEDEHPGVGNEHGYVADGKLYCDVGTPLWDTLVTQGVLTGEDARPLAELALGRVALHVVRIAEQKKDLDLVAMWLNFGPLLLFPKERVLTRGQVLGKSPFTGKDIVVEEDSVMPREPTVAELEADADACALRSLGLRLDAANVRVHYDYRPPVEARSEAELWFWGDAGTGA